MKALIVSGSHRSNSESARVSGYIASRLQHLQLAESVEVLDLSATKLPEWGGAVGDPHASEWMEPWKPVMEQLAASDALILVSPEWNGMVPPRLKNFLLVASSFDKPAAHKPGYIVTVSASQNGAYPVLELRTSGYKNLELCFIPEHMIVRHAPQIFSGETPKSQDDEYLRGRLDYGLKVLAEYSKALRLVRESGVIDHKSYPNGM